MLLYQTPGLMCVPPLQGFDCHNSEMFLAETGDDTIHPQCTAQPHDLVKSQSTLNAQGCQTWVITHYPDERFLLGEMGSVNTKMRLCFKLLHFSPTFTRPIALHGTSVPRMLSESEGKWEQRSILIITVMTHICIFLYYLSSVFPTLTQLELHWGRKSERFP